MEINAKYFGNITFKESDIIWIEEGLIGFSSYIKYLPISFEEGNDGMISLQSLEEEGLSFILMNPFKLFPHYNPVLSEEDMRQLGAEREEDISYYVISVIGDSIADSTVNLKAPLAVNAKNRKAKQVILEQPEYTFRHYIEDVKSKEDV